MASQKKSALSPTTSKYSKAGNITKILILLLMVVMLITSPLILKPHGDFAGTDDRAKNTIGEIQKEYKPWFKPLWEPPSKEIESLLFTLQASAGAAVIAFYLGFLYGKNKGKK